MHSVKNEGELYTRRNACDRGAQTKMLYETLLVLELTHRIANDWTCAFATISELARRSSSPTVKSTLSKLSSHLMRQAELMQTLIPDSETNHDAAIYLERVCLAISRTRLEELNIHLVFAAEPIAMAANCCLRLGMIVCELLTNSARNAFSDHRGGTIRVELCRRGLIAECRVSDTGCARPNSDAGYGFAIARELIASLGGSIDQELGPSGSTSILQLPL